MSVEDAIQTLAAAAQDVKEQPVAQQPAVAVNLLADAMDKTAQPNIGADAGDMSEVNKLAADIDVVANFLKQN